MCGWRGEGNMRHILQGHGNGGREPAELTGPRVGRDIFCKHNQGNQELCEYW